jgi:hypothetical protein
MIEYWADRGRMTRPLNTSYSARFSGVVGVSPAS